MSEPAPAHRQAPLRLVLMGTGPFGVPTFRRLLEGRHEVVGVVTGALHPARRRKAPPPSPVRALAREAGCPLQDPESVNEEAAREALAAWGADLLVVCDYGRILSAATLGTARLGGVNLHGSLLPAYRGAAPIAWALYHGEAHTGVSVIHMTPRVDAGPVIAQASTPIGPDETAVELEARLADLGAEVVPGAIEDLVSGRVRPIPQDPERVSKAPKLQKRDGLLDWSRPARALHDHVRAMQPWPGAYTFWRREAVAEPLRLVLGPLVPVGVPERAVPPGTVLEADGDGLVVAAGEGACRLTALQPAGKRMLAADAFLRGYPLRAGMRLG